MAKDKKYYWLKLKKDFFKRHDIEIIEGMENGKDYILFYLKLLCESVSHDGNLRFSDEIPYDEKMLSTITRTNIDIVRSAIKIFAKLGMMEVLDDGTFYMSEVQKMLGHETYWAEQKRIQRAKNLKEIGQCPTSPSKSIEIELEKDIEIDNNNILSVSDNNTTEKTKEIITYLNDRCSTNYRSSGKKTRSLIKARLNDGFEVEDFKTVIDKKADEWIGTEYEKFLRPETLFGTKFEGYLNQRVVRSKNAPIDWDSV